MIIDKAQAELHILNIERLGLSTTLPGTLSKIRVFFDYNGMIYRKPIINNLRSPYKVIDNLISYKKNILDVKIARFLDDVPDPYYFRSPEILVINSTFLSPCNQGCLFCEQTQVKKEKRRYSIHFNPRELFEKVLKENNIRDLSRLKQISIITSCAGSEERAIELLEGYKKAACQIGFKGKFLFATNEIRSIEALKKLALVGNIILAFTVECFSKRKTLMPGSKGNIKLKEIKMILEEAKKIGIETTYFYIIGLDNLRDMKKGFQYLKEAVSYAPTYSIYYHQSNSKSEFFSLRPMKYYLKAKELYNIIHKGLIKFESCQSFRSLWPLENNENQTIVQ